MFGFWFSILMCSLLFRLFSCSVILFGLLFDLWVFLIRLSRVCLIWVGLN